MWLLIVGVLMLVMKLAEFGPFGELSWWWIGAPFVGAVLWWEFADRSGYTKRKAMDRMDERKEARRQKAVDAIGQGEKTRRRR